jgi:hypothetical protein
MTKGVHLSDSPPVATLVHTGPEARKLQEDR